MEATLRRPLAQLSATYSDEELAREIELEERMVTLGRDQVRKQIANARQSGNESGTGYGKALIARSIDEIAAAITRFIDKAKTSGAGRRHIAVKYLEQVDADVAAYIALRLVVDSLTGKRLLLQSVNVQIGKRIEDEARFAKFKDTDARMYSRALERASSAGSYQRKRNSMAGYERRFSDEWTSWPEQDCLHIGAALVDMIIQTGLVELTDEISSRRDTVKRLVPTQRIADWIENEATRSEMMYPSHMPMVIKPLDWEDPFNGGYVTVDAQGRNAMVKTGNMNYLTELADHADEMPVVYDSLNALQSTRWRINPRVHAVLTEVWERGLPVAKLPDREDIQFCQCPQCDQMVPLAATDTRHKSDHICFEDPEVLREWKMRAFKLHSKNISTRSKRMSLAKTLNIAGIYADFEAIYFPYQLDFRGRVYAIPSFNPQGNDATKGLLQFADAKPIEDGVSAGWLAIHGANVYGFDKASLEDRIGWVEEHEQEIVAVAEDPLSNRFWHDADKPWQFLAFCFEWAGFLEEGYGFMSRMAVALDGSCSGIQHFSAMLRDDIGGRAVNLLPAETPEDIYQRVCDRVVMKLEADLSSTIAQANASTPLPPLKEGKPEASAKATALLAKAIGEYDDGVFALGWLALQPSRKTTKRQVMTLPYGSTPYSCREYTSEWYKEQLGSGAENPFPPEVSFKAVQYLSNYIWESISEVVIAARSAMDWLQGCAKVVAAEQLPVYWTTPVGFRVMQQYRNTTSKRVKTKIGDAIIKLSLQEEKDTIDKRRMANAISPNFVHSMDATHLMQSVSYATDNGVNSFAMIHDSFGTHAADTNMLAACLREAFVDLYTDMDVLEDFRQQIIRQVDEDNQKQVKPVPPKGNLDINEVRSSDFFFC